MSPARLLLPALVVALLAAGCGSSDEQQAPTATATTPAAPPGASVRSCDGTVAGTTRLRVTGVACDLGERVATEWARLPACSSPAGASRYSCSVNGYRCLGATGERGIAVSCGRPGSSVAFVAKPG